MIVFVFSPHLFAKPIDLSGIKRDALNRFDIYDGEVVTLDWNPATVAGGNRRVVHLSYLGKPYTLELQPHSSRSKNYKLIVQQTDGTYQEMTPGPDKSMRGRILEIDGSEVAASISNDGLTARMILPDDSELWVEPMAGKVANAQAHQHIVYHGDDVTPTGLDCSVLDPPVDPEAVIFETQSSTEIASGSVAATECTGLFIAEIAIDADYDYFVKEDSSVLDVEEQVTNIITAMNVQYERDVCIRHVITAIIVRTAEPDPYFSTDADTLLSQLKTQWQTNHDDISRDVVQLFTGKNLDGTTIGVAWRGDFPSVSTICGSWGYNVVESDCGITCNNFSTKTDLSAHELGHNWSAGHCSCINWTMNPSIQSANRFHPDDGDPPGVPSTETIPVIMAFRDTRNCLDAGDELRRIIASPTPFELVEGDSIQLSATAVFRFGADQDVTDQVIWSVDPPAVGSVDTNGMFTANDVNGTVCVTITAEYTYDGITRTGFIFLSIDDLDNPMAIVSGYPENGVIDARIPSHLDGSNPVGLQIFDITLNGEICNILVTDFSVMVQGGSNPAPAIISKQEIDATTVRLFLTDPIEPGAWTTIIHDLSGSSIRVGYLPGDVNGDAVSNAEDIHALIDILNGNVVPGPLWSRDIDRSGRSFPSDLLMLINVLNGADALDPWMGATLP